MSYDKLIALLIVSALVILLGTFLPAALVVGLIIYISEKRKKK